MVEILRAKAAYRANVAAEKVAQDASKQTLDLVG